jgi:anti-anti-sigma factor
MHETHAPSGELQLAELPARADADAAPFWATVCEEPDGVGVLMRGELDIATDWWADLVLTVACRRQGTLVVDLRELRFMGCSSVPLLLEASRRAAAQGRRLIVLTRPGSVHRTLRLLGLEERLGVLDLPAARLRTT